VTIKVATNLETETDKRWISVTFYVIAIIFNLCLVAQLLTVGVAYFNNPSWWNIHICLVRGYGGLSVVLWGISLIAQFNSKIKNLATALSVLTILQFASIHLKTPLHLEIFHPLIGFSLFYMSSSLVHAISRILLSQPQQI
jgi:hypothetical protein